MAAANRRRSAAFSMKYAAVSMLRHRALRAFRVKGTSQKSIGPNRARHLYSRRKPHVHQCQKKRRIGRMRRFFGRMGSVSRVTIESQALKGNMLGDPTERVVDVYVPAGHTDKGCRCW